jgi:hypothetical protein
MTDAYQPGRLNRLRHTPLRDVLRGRINGKLDVRARIAAASLPAPAAQLITRVVKRSRLRRTEKVDVADELIAHFADGLASGATADALVRDFGDERAAARLICRAKKRNRPLAWHLFKYVSRALLVLVGIYSLLILRMFLSSPTVKVDYLAQLNAPILSVAVEDRAWPLYRKALLGLDLVEQGKPDAERKAVLDRIDRLDLAPGDANWAQLSTWIGAHTGDIESIRAGAAKPSLGFVLGPKGSAVDPELHWDLYNTPRTRLIDQSIVSTLLPNLQLARTMAKVLAVDAAIAREARDGKRLTADLDAMRGVSRQCREQFIIGELVSSNIDMMLLAQLEKTLSLSPELLDESQLIRLAHRLGQMGGRTADSVIDVKWEQIAFRDVMQRLYTDDGHGDGRLTAQGARDLQALSAITAGRSLNLAFAATSLGLLPITSTRKDIENEYDRLLGLTRAQFSRPGREVAAEGSDQLVQQRIDEIRDSAYLCARYLPLAIMAPNLNTVQLSTEKMLGRRDGLTVGLALEVYRRRHGSYPATLDALSPELLPQVPEDRIVGGEVHYCIIDGRPVVYSIGVDHDDDGGKVPPGKDGMPAFDAAALWHQPAASGKPIDGDWILYDGRPNGATPTTVRADPTGL